MNTAATLVALALVSAPAEDPRIELVKVQLVGQRSEALAATEKMLATQPDLARRLGLEYLRGRLLAELDQAQEASTAYLTSISTSPGLAMYSYFRLALEHERQGHPEMAAGLVAKVVASSQPLPIRTAAIRLLRRSLAAGGDCRLLGGLREQQLDAADRREIQLARAECALATGETPRAAGLISKLLAETREDDIAYQAARLAADRQLAPVSQELLLAVGLALHQHRDFARSNQYLDRSLSALVPGRVLDGVSFSQHYARSRNDFWLGTFKAAAERFAGLSEVAPTAEKKADALYQQGRSHELANEWTAASASFRRAYLADPAGEWGGAALLSALRLEWRAGNEAAAREAYQLLLALRGSREHAARGALFLAASDLAQGRADRADGWLADAQRMGGGVEGEVEYWRGRLAERLGNIDTAVLAYGEVLRSSAYSPFAEEAGKRLRSSALNAASRDQGVRLGGSARVSDWSLAWHLLGDGHPRGPQLLKALASHWEAQPGVAPFFRLSEVPVEKWPLWAQPLGRPEETMLALGLFGEGAPAVARHFPTSNPTLAFTGSLHLARAGQIHESLRLAEILSQRLPKSLPHRLLLPAFRRLLYPLPYREQIEQDTTRHGIEPWLLAGIVREESRFDPNALSGASARGLTQFTQQTAARFGSALGKSAIEPYELYEPEVALALGAAYLKDLADTFQGIDAPMVAAYNAGEDQARLWLAHCFTKDRAEYLSKVSFRQTRAYVVKVLSSRNQYREIYAGSR